MSRRSHGTGKRGVAFAEFVLVMPFLLFLFAAAIEYGFMIYDSMILQDAAREGARWAGKNETDEQTLARVTGYFPLRNITSPTVTIQEFNTAEQEITPHQRIPGSVVKVTVACSVQWLTPIQVIFGGTAYGLSSSASYRVENP